MELTNQAPECIAAAAGVLTRENPPTPAENVRAWWKKARRVYPEATLRAWRFDWAAFLSFCKPRGLLPLPAAPSTVAAFIGSCGEVGKKPATVRRYLATIACAHRAAKILNPNDDEDVKMALKGLYNKSPKRQRQAKALGWHEIKRFLITAGDNIRADRERALLAVAYDTMARRSELVAMDVEDFGFMQDGSGRVIIRRSKTDQQGEGSLAYLSPDTVEYLQAWLKVSRIGSGAVFRRLIGRGRIGPRLQVDAIAQTFKRVAEFVGMTGEEMRHISGHSIRVGATQDMLALNIDLASVMQAGRWKTTVMPMRYGEEVHAGRGGMARTAKAQGREARRQSRYEQNPGWANTQMQRTANSSAPAPMTLDELEKIIAASGGQGHARTFAEPLLVKVRVLEERGTYGGLLEPIRTARDQADLRGRLLELNLAYQFECAGVHPEVGAKQGGAGDIDFRFNIDSYDVYLETKLLRQADSTTKWINSQLAASNTFGVLGNDDTRDIARLQRDLIQKANPKKFDSKPKANWINLVGVDVSELQLGMADLGDCLLAAGGNPVAAAYFYDAVRPNVVGLFERISTMTPGEAAWANELNALVGSAQHPREYIHGAIFLFRTPKDTAALVHTLSAVVIWNSALVTHEMAEVLEPAIHKIVPRPTPRK